MAAMFSTPTAPPPQPVPQQPLPTDQEIQNASNDAARNAFRQGRASNFLADPTKDQTEQSASRLLGGVY
jgi:hypothetical protein